ncbi:MAG: GTPase Era [Eubacteriales bacterium]|nr:GTPase Era [Eubacteriales bacterium]
MKDKDFRSGFIAIIGRPNVGKSTLVNRLVGEKVAIVSPKPQTTRSRLMGIVNLPNAQLVLLDTPGIHKARTKLGQFMMDSVDNALSGIDALFIMLDASSIKEQDKKIIQQYESLNVPIFLLINKTDTVHPTALLPVIDTFSSLKLKAILPISAKTGEGLDKLIELIIPFMPIGPKYFPDDMLTDQPERVLIAELIREKTLLYLKEEVPHGIGVEINKIENTSDTFSKIQATIYCEKDSHKKIIIGAGGGMIKKIGSEARKDIETLLGHQAHLELWVKVRENWKNSVADLKTLGYTEG